jgi:hypothetical protein
LDSYSNTAGGYPASRRGDSKLTQDCGLESFLNKGVITFSLDKLMFLDEEMNESAAVEY